MLVVRIATAEGGMATHEDEMRVSSMRWHVNCKPDHGWAQGQCEDYCHGGICIAVLCDKSTPVILLRFKDRAGACESRSWVVQC